MYVHHTDDLRHYGTLVPLTPSNDKALFAHMILVSCMVLRPVTIISCSANREYFRFLWSVFCRRNATEVMSEKVTVLVPHIRKDYVQLTLHLLLPC